MISFPETEFFFELLTEYELYGNGYCWEGLVEQLLEQDMPEIFDSIITFDAEADNCLILFTNEASLKRVAQHINHVCTDEKRFRGFLQEIDRDRIDD